MKKIYISTIIFLGLTILLIVFGVWPLFSEIKKISQDFPVQKQKLMVLEKKEENLEKFKRTFPKISSELEKIDNLFIDPKVPVDFIRFLEEISQVSGISLKISLAPLLKIEKDPWSSVSFQLNLVGSFPNILKFLEKLKSTSYLIEIQNLTVTRLSESELKSKEFENFSLGDVKAVLLIKTYTK